MFSSSDQGLNIPLTTSPQYGSLSPYLNFDPAYVTQSGPEFIFPEGASSKRGRFELAFSQIGGSVMSGAFIGGLNGFYTGLRETSLAQQTGSIRRTQLLNYITKGGAGFANTLGTIAVMYSGFGVIVSLARGVDDELNTLAAATMTGMLYKSSAGLRKCALGGGIGLGAATIFLLFTSRERIKSMLQGNIA